MWYGGREKPLEVGAISSMIQHVSRAVIPSWQAPSSRRSQGEGTKETASAALAAAWVRDACPHTPCMHCSSKQLITWVWSERQRADGGRGARPDALQGEWWWSGGSEPLRRMNQPFSQPAGQKLLPWLPASDNWRSPGPRRQAQAVIDRSVVACSCCGWKVTVPLTYCTVTRLGSVARRMQAAAAEP
jgi:hypothetical protein